MPAEVKNGFYLSLSLILIHKALLSLVCIYESMFIVVLIFLTFGFTIFYFLTKKDIKYFFISGITGLFALIAAEILLSSLSDIFFSSFVNSYYLLIYLIGFFVSMASAFISFIYVLLNKRKEEKVMEIKKALSDNIGKTLKIKLSVFAVLSAVSFSYLVLPENSGIGVFVFAIIQAIALYFITNSKKRLFLYIPVIILALNSFISANTMWRVSNIFVSIFLYSLVFTDFKISFFINLIKNVFRPLSFMLVPFKWAGELDKEKTAVVKRIIKAILITVPVVIILLVLLSSADLIFQNDIDNMITIGIESINMNTITKIIAGVFAGLYLFGVVYNSYINKSEKFECDKKTNADILVIGIIFVTILFVYTYFVVIQFKYLFAMAELPYGLTYTEYARRGFFELMFLTGINIAIIMASLFVSNKKSKKTKIFIKTLCCYLCTVTIVLLASSFYRMWLYNSDDGLTRLRFMVFGFLIFEAIGLFYTFVHIIKPYFNLSAVYLTLGLVYYLILNTVPIDYFVAKSQVDMYINGKRDDVSYALSLSADAAPQIERLFETEEKEKAEFYFKNKKEYYESIPKRWQRYNLSVERCKSNYQKSGASFIIP